MHMCRRGFESCFDGFLNIQSVAHTHLVEQVHVQLVALRQSAAAHQLAEVLGAQIFVLTQRTALGVEELFEVAQLRSKALIWFG